MPGRKRRPPADDLPLAPLPLPSGSRVPDPTAGPSTPAEYDRYFRIVRSNPSLLEWSRACLHTQDVQLRELERTTLTPEDKCRILHGMLLVQRITLQTWVRTGDALGPDA